MKILISLFARLTVTYNFIVASKIRPNYEDIILTPYGAKCSADMLAFAITLRLIINTVASLFYIGRNT